MIKNIIFDLGAVVIDWDPHHLYDPYFGNREKAEWFLQNICTREWNTLMDAGLPFSKGIKAKVEQFPEWEKEINLYFEGSTKMIGGLIPGTSEYAIELYTRGYKLFALTNWSYETFSNVTGFEFFKYLSGMVVSGYEKIVKPSPEIYKLLMSRYQITASECIFIDDIQHNVDGARAVGMQALQFSSCRQLKNDLEPLLLKK